MMIETGRRSAEALERLSAIGRYSTWVRLRVRHAAATPGSPCPVPPIHLSDLRSHLRTLRVLNDVLLLTGEPRLPVDAVGR